MLKVLGLPTDHPDESLGRPVGLSQATRLVILHTEYLKKNALNA